MKKLFLLLLVTFITSITFAQDISGPQPILSVGGSNITPDFSSFTLGCGTNSLRVSASYNSDIGSPDEYRVEQVPFHEKSYLPIAGGSVLTPAALGVPGQMISNLSDDTWSPRQQLASNGSNLEFCYFGEPKTEFVVSSNGMLSFDISYENSFSQWAVHGMGKIDPDANCGDGSSGNDDSILQFHDTNPADGDAEFDSYMFWAISGIENERFLNMGTHHMPMFSCGANYGYANHQMVLYETTNIIEFNIRDKPLCEAWANGQQGFGLQNDDSTIGIAVPGLDNAGFANVYYQILNQSDPYNATHTNPAEPVHDSVSYRFIPDGPNGTAPVFGWYINWDDVANTGTLVTSNIDLDVYVSDLPYDANGDPIPVVYTAVTTYVEFCSGNVYHSTNNVTLQAIPVRMHIREANSANDNVEEITVEPIFLCEGEDYLLEAIVNINDPNVNYTLEWSVESFGNPNTVVDDGDGDPLTYNITGASPLPSETYVYTCTLTATGDVNCVFSDTVVVTVFDDNTTMNYPAPKVFCANEANPAPENVFPVPATTATQEDIETYYYTVTNGGVWLNPLASDPTRSLDGIVDLDLSFTNATTTNADNSADYDITYHAHCPNNTITDIIKIRNAPLVLNPAIGDSTATPIIIPSDLIKQCETNTTLHTGDFDIAGINNYIANGTPLADLNIVWESNTASIVLPNPMPASYNTTTLSVTVTVTDPNDPAACEVELTFDLTPIVVNQVATTPSSSNYIVQCERIISGVGQDNAEFLYNSITNEILSLVLPIDLPNSTVVFEAFIVANDGTETPYTLPDFEVIPSPYYFPSLRFRAKIKHIYDTYIDPNTGDVYVDPNTGEKAEYYCYSNEVTFEFEVRDIAEVTIPSIEGITTPIEDDAVLTLCETDITSHTAGFDTSTWDTIILSANVDNAVTPPLNPDFVVVYEYTDILGVVQTRNDVTPLENPLIFNVGLHQIKVKIINKNINQNCTSITRTFDVTVNPLPIEEVQPPIAVCSTQNTAVFNVNIALSTYATLTGNTYTWYAEPNAAAQSLSTADVANPETTATIEDRVTNTTLIDQTVVYHIIPTSENTAADGEPSNGCPGDEIVISVTIQPEPILDTAVYTAALPNCSGNIDFEVILENIFTLTGNSYSWYAEPNANITGITTSMASPSTALIIGDDLVNINTSGLEETVAYHITPTSAATNSCAGIEYIIEVNVGFAPTITAKTEDTCSDTALNIDLHTYDTVLTGNTYEWYAMPNANVMGISNTDVLNPTVATSITDNLSLVAGIVVPTDVVYVVTPKSANDCVGNPFTVTVTVRPLPVEVPQPPIAVCSTQNTAVFNVNIALSTYATLTDNTYTWYAEPNVAAQSSSTADVANPETTATIEDSITNTTLINQTVVYHIIPTSENTAAAGEPSNGCAGAEIVISVTIQPEPILNTAVYTAALPNCSGNIDFEVILEDIFTLTGNSYSWYAEPNANVTGITTSAGSPSTALIIGDDLININASGLEETVAYHITPTSAVPNSCAGIEYIIEVSVGFAPIISNQTEDTCSDTALNIDLHTYDTVLTGNTYEWYAMPNANVMGISNTDVLNPTVATSITDNLSLVAGVVLPTDVVYVVTPKSANDCVGNPFTVTVTVRPLPVEVPQPPIAVCSTQNTAVLNVNIALSTYATLTDNTYTWYAEPNAAAQSLSTADALNPETTATIEDRITNTTSIDQTVVYHIIPTSENTAAAGEPSNACAGAEIVISVTIQPEPILDTAVYTGPLTNCSSGTAFEIILEDYFTLTSNSYSWYAEPNANVSGITTSMASPSTALIIDDVLVNNSPDGSLETVTYHIIPTSAATNSCAGIEYIIKVELRYKPIGVDTDLTICSGEIVHDFDANDDPINFDLDSVTTFEDNVDSINNNTYKWKAINNNDVTGETTVEVTTDDVDTLISDVLVNTSSSVKYVIYEVIPTSEFGCEGDMFTVTVEVGFAPNMTDQTEEICNDVALAIDLNDYTTLAGNSYRWKAVMDYSDIEGETLTEQNTNTIEDTLINVSGASIFVEYEVVPKSSGQCEGNRFLVTVEVHPRPQFELEPQYFICPEIQEVVIGEDNPDDYTYHWYEANDMNIIIGYDETLLVSVNDLLQSNGTYVLTVTDSLGCTYSQFTSVSMAEQMIITDVSVSDFNRPNNTIIVEVTGGSGDFEYTLNTIDYAGNSQTIVQNNPRFDSVVAGTYQIEVLDQAGCSVSVVTDDIYVLDYPPFFTPNGDLQHDTWQITGANFIPNSKIYIFDRFGKVLAQIDPNSVVGWDGTYNGIQVPASDYWFTCEYIDPNTGLSKSVKGNFSIVRK